MWVKSKTVMRRPSYIHLNQIAEKNKYRNNTLIKASKEMYKNTTIKEKWKQNDEKNSYQ